MFSGLLLSSTKVPEACLRSPGGLKHHSSPLIILRPFISSHLLVAFQLFKDNLHLSIPNIHHFLGDSHRLVCCFHFTQPAFYPFSSTKFLVCKTVWKYPCSFKQLQVLITYWQNFQYINLWSQLINSSGSNLVIVHLWTQNSVQKTSLRCIASNMEQATAAKHKIAHGTKKQNWVFTLCIKKSGNKTKAYHFSNNGSC